MIARSGIRRCAPVGSALAAGLAAAWLGAFDARGAVAWTTLYDGPAHGDEIVNAVARDAGGNLYVAGSTMTASGTTDVLLVKLSPAGALLWQVVSDPSGGGDDRAVALALDSAANPVLAGSTRLGSDSDVLVQKYTAAGALSWQRTLSCGTTNDDEAVALGIDAMDRVVVCGSQVTPASPGLDTGPDFLFLQFATDGTPGWVIAIDGGAASADYPAAMAITPAGEVVATGISTRSDQTTDVFTVRLRADGTTRWTRLYAGASGDDDWGQAIALNGSGVAFLTGFIETGATSADCIALEYDADGALVWARTFDGPLGDHDSGHAIALDGGGNVFVTGATRDAGGAFDVLTLKYDASGSLQWSRAYDGPGQAYDEGGALVPDGAGGIVCAAQSAGALGDRDIATLHYDAGGGLIGQYRYDGSAYDWDSPSAVLLQSANVGIVAGMSAEATNEDDAVVSTFDPSTLVGVPDPPALPLAVALGPIQPHPLRGAGVLHVDLPRPSTITLDVLDVAGRRVAVIAADSEMPAGRHAQRLELPSLPGGVYIVRLTVRDDTGAVVRRRKLVLLP